MIIPKKYGGLEFSAYAHSCVLVKLASRSATCVLHGRRAELARARPSCSTTTAPRSRRTTTCRASRAARRFPASRSPARAPAPMPPRSRTPASSAAASGRAARCSGLKLNFSKRYITLAPVATVIGLAFRMFDPDKLLGEQDRHRHHLRADPARHARASTIGRRHFPLNIPFQNGPIQGKDVFVPLDCIIGGAEDGRPGLAHAGRAALGRPLHLAAVQRHRRRQGRRCGRPAPTRASAGSSTCRSASSRASRR